MNRFGTSSAIIAAAFVLVAGSSAWAGVIYSHTSDATSRSGNWYQDYSHPEDLKIRTGRMGDDAPRRYGAAILVFQLPDLGPITDPFTSVQLQIAGTNTGDTGGDENKTRVNLYGLDRVSDSPDVDVTNDDGDLANNSDIDYGAPATLLEDEYLRPWDDSWGPGGEVDGKTTGTEELDFFNAQYDGGANAGKYVFLRLSHEYSWIKKWKGYDTYAGEALTDGDPATMPPTITYQAVPEPASLALLGLGGLVIATRQRTGIDKSSKRKRRRATVATASHHENDPKPNHGGTTMNLLKTTICLAALTIAFAAPAVRGNLITTADGNGADNHVRPDQGNDYNEAWENHGNEETVLAKNASGRWKRNGYIRFDLSSLPAQTITDAVLKLDVTSVDGSGAIEVYGLNDGSTSGNGENWDEMTTGWEDAPGNDPNKGNNLFLAAESTLLGSFAMPASPQVLSFSDDDLPTFLNADTDGLVTLMFRADSDGEAIEFASRENTSGAAPPTLDITLVPEPATLTLLGLGGLALIRRRR